MYLFAYGTLKDPALLTAIVGPVRCRVIGAGAVGGMLYDMGSYPALRPGESSDDTVPGVLIELDDESALGRLDAYEDVGSGLYVRERCEVRLADGRCETAWVYIYNR